MFNDFLNSFRKRIGFTETEIKIIIFLAVIFIAGLGLKFVLSGKETVYTNYDYSKSDSLFSAVALQASIPAQIKDTIDKPVSEDQLINQQSYKPKTKIALKEKSININKAGLNELTQLPGIGIKTAEKIIEYRNAKGRFKTPDELIEVKGIGEKKLEKIKKLIFIE